MEISHAQQQIRSLLDCINENHQHPNPEMICYMKVVEELGEMTEVILKTMIRSRKSEQLSREECRDELSKELADAVIAMISLANDFDIDLDAAIKRKLSVHQERNT